MAPTVTTTRQRVESYFTKYFEQKAEEKKAKAKTRIRPKHYGEGLTEDDIFERIKQEQEEREQKKIKRKQRDHTKQVEQVDKNTYQECKDHYDEDDNTSDF